MEQREQADRVNRREQAVAGESIGQAKRVIDLIEQRVNEAYRVPLRKDMCVIEASMLIDLIGQLRIALPKTVVQAQSVLAEKEKILEDARIEADKTADAADQIYKDVVKNANQYRDETHQEAENYLAQTHQKADDEANAIIEDAKQRADQIVYGAQQQAQRLLSEHEIVRRAQAFALEVQDTASKNADNIYQQACSEVDRMLSSAATLFSHNADDLMAMRDQLLNQGV